jgi:sugar O-acyltransferase (sialic acid O-acetyltransferase NeuD family)
VRRLAILGASGHGKVVADIAELNGWDEVFFFDDAWPELKTNSVWAVVGSTDDLLVSIHQYDGVIIAIGNNEIRLNKLNLLKQKNILLPSIIHPDAIISRYAKIDDACVVCAGVVVNADASIGFGSILNTGCSIDHDCSLAEAVHISPGARLAGGTQVGQCSWLGIGAVTRQLISIGSNVVIGAGSVVVKNVAPNMVVVGNPAKILERK